MKLMIGENNRSYRKKNGLTQEEFAERLGVTYQSVSGWENGATYPDLELIPSISELLGITVDGLLGMPMRERERRASETFDALRRECMKRNYDTKRISELLREIRRDHIDSDANVRPRCVCSPRRISSDIRCALRPFGRWQSSMMRSICRFFSKNIPPRLTARSVL